MELESPDSPKETHVFEMVTPVVETTADTETYGRFVIEPLESGFGLTVGNALRRVLLSSLPGAAVTAVTIEGVHHEFSTIPGVKEDSIDLLLNVKSIRIRALSDRAGELTLDVSGERIVTAGDIVTTADFEIANPDQYLCTLDTKDSRISIIFSVEPGKGYQPAVPGAGLEIGKIAVDAIFTPVRKVNYVVETTRIGVDNFDRLILEVWTDGTVNPAEAVNRAAQILADHFTTIGSSGRPSAVRGGDRVALAAGSAGAQGEVPIEDLDLSVRAYNCLKRAGITKVAQILEMSEEDLLNVRNFGRKSLDELREKLLSRGFIDETRFTGASLPADDEADEAEDGDE